MLSIIKRFIRLQIDSLIFCEAQDMTKTIGELTW